MWLVQDVWGKNPQNSWRKFLLFTFIVAFHITIWSAITKTMVRGSSQLSSFLGDSHSYKTFHSSISFTQTPFLKIIYILQVLCLYPYNLEIKAYTLLPHIENNNKNKQIRIGFNIFYMLLYQINNKIWSTWMGIDIN